MIRLEMRSSKLVSVSVNTVVISVAEGNHFEIYIQKVLVLAET